MKKFDFQKTQQAIAAFSEAVTGHRKTFVPPPDFSRHYHLLACGKSGVTMSPGSTSSKATGVGCSGFL